MTGSGPAGEITYHDIRRRLADTVAHIVAAEMGHDATAAELAAERDSRPTVGGAGDSGA